MIRALFLTLLVGMLIVVSVQNAGVTAVKFLAWHFALPLSTITGAAVLAGVLIAQILRSVSAKRRDQQRRTVEFISRKRF